MQEIKINKGFLTAFYAAGILGMLIFASRDLPISLGLYNAQNRYGIFMELFGDYPLYLMLGTGSTYLLMEELKKAKKHWGKCFLWGIGSLTGAVLSGMIPIYRSVEMKPLYFLTVPGFLILFIIAARMIPEEKREDIQKLSKFFVIYFVAAQVIAYGIKIPWGRLRFRNMAEPLKEFIPWYLPQGITGHHSFPSGHTFNACGVFLLLYLPGIKRPEKRGLYGRNGWLPWLLCCFWVVSVAVGRIVAGAHFASDVTMGAMLGVGTFCFMNQYCGTPDEKA